jgi:hypothetical protein
VKFTDCLLKLAARSLLLLETALYLFSKNKIKPGNKLKRYNKNQEAITFIVVNLHKTINS